MSYCVFFLKFFTGKPRYSGGFTYRYVPEKSAVGFLEKKGTGYKDESISDS